MPALPESRVTPSAPFTITGLDYLGPLFVKQPKQPEIAQKVWVCLFTCLATRALHLELVLDMSAEQFLLSLRRFISRRGAPAAIISDNASQFKLVKSACDRVWSSVIKDPTVISYVANQNIQWKFIPERAPWMGGYYERLVRSVKQCLRKSLGRICLSFIQLQTILTEVEAVINSRPLLYASADFHSGYNLTPAHFLTLNKSTGVPELSDEFSEDPNYVNRLSSRDKLLMLWKKGQHHLDQFWRMWKQDYLLSLRERYQTALKGPHCQAPNPAKIGDVVHIQNEGPRGTWQLGEITSLIQSADGAVRSVKIRLASGKTLTRSITHAYPLEVSNEAPSPPQNKLERPRSKCNENGSEGKNTQPKRKAAEPKYIHTKASSRNRRIKFEVRNFR